MNGPGANKKYELLPNDTVKVGDRTLVRIRALRDFQAGLGNDSRKIKAGDLGGYVESEANLSQEGDCWVADKARICENARVTDSAFVSEDALIRGYALVCDYAQISGGAVVCGHALVEAHSQLFANALVGGYARVSDKARIYGHAVVDGNAYVFDHADVVGRVSGHARIGGETFVHDHERLGGTTQLSSNDELNNDLQIWGQRLSAWRRRKYPKELEKRLVDGLGERAQAVLRSLPNNRKPSKKPDPSQTFGGGAGSSALPSPEAGGECGISGARLSSRPVWNGQSADQEQALEEYRQRLASAESWRMLFDFWSPVPSFHTDGDSNSRYVRVELPTQTVLRDYGNKITTLGTRDDRDIVVMIEMAKQRGWTQIQVDGSDDFKEKIRKEATRRGLEIAGDALSRTPRAELDAWEAHVENELPSRGYYSQAPYKPPRNPLDELLEATRLADPQRANIMRTQLDQVFKENPTGEWPDTPYHYGMGRIRAYEEWRDSLGEKELEKEIRNCHTRYEAYYQSCADLLMKRMTDLEIDKDPRDKGHERTNEKTPRQPEPGRYARLIKEINTPSEKQPEKQLQRNLSRGLER